MNLHKCYRYLDIFKVIIKVYNKNEIKIEVVYFI
jgi:hypothetical protein